MSLFITGTGTGVGKTIVTAGLAACWKHRLVSVCVYKPIQTGSPDPAHPEDPGLVQLWAGTEIPVYNTYCFPEPVAPLVADPTGLIRPERILTEYRRLQTEYDVVLVEGAGGIRVPIARDFDMRNLARLLALPVLVVASPWLGTINQTVLTLDSLAAAQLPVHGVVISGMPEQSEDPAVATLVHTLQSLPEMPRLITLPEWPLEPGYMAQPAVWQAFAPLAQPALSKVL